MSFGAWDDPPACGKEDSPISRALVVGSPQALMEDALDIPGPDALVGSKRHRLGVLTGYRRLQQHTCAIPANAVPPILVLFVRRLLATCSRWKYIQSSATRLAIHMQS